MPARLDLDRDVGELEAVTSAGLYEVSTAPLVSPVGTITLGTHRVHSRGERPDMQVVDGTDSSNRLEASPEFLYVHVSGRAPQEYADRFAQQVPRPRKDEQANCRRDERVGEEPSGSVDDDRSHDGTQ